MGDAYRCDKCGTFHDGRATEVCVYPVDAGEASILLCLCPKCLPEVAAPLAKLAVTEQRSIV